VQIRLLYKIHLWSGLIGGVLLFAEVMTGLAIEFRQELHPFLHPTVPVAARGTRQLTVANLTNTVKTQFPGLRIERVIPPPTLRDPVWFRLAPRGAGGLPHFVLMNPFSGQVLQEGPLTAFPCELALYLHATLLAGVAGEAFIGVEGLALLLLAVTGVILWWPGVRKLFAHLRVRSRQPAAVLLLDLHKLLGVCTLIGLCVVAITGSGLAFEPLLPSSAARNLEWMRPVHTGWIAGATGRVLVFVFGWCLLALTITGLWMWFEREKLRRVRSRLIAKSRSRVGRSNIG
jgi:uncharacterized iron-regulated membrane protein